MRETIFARIQRWLRGGYILSRPVDTSTGSTPVVFLHGVGSSAGVWEHVYEALSEDDVRMIGFDLLGFGSSPKPDVAYTLDDHAAAVIASLSRLRLKQPAILVGHSMGALVAVRIARRRPDLVRHLVLYEMPLYDGLPEKRRYRWLIDFYYRLYARIAAFQPDFNADTILSIDTIARKIIGLDLTAETWEPFTRSLKHAIMQQTTGEDLQHVTTPIDVIFGSFDLLVIRGQVSQIYNHPERRINTRTVRAGHAISKRASQYIAEHIRSALQSNM